MKVLVISSHCWNALIAFSPREVTGLVFMDKLALACYNIEMKCCMVLWRFITTKVLLRQD